MKKKYYLILILVIQSFMYAQDKVNINLSADLVSRYNWRGTNIGNTPCIQPSLMFSYCKTSIGVWGSYPFTNQDNKMEEIDFWVTTQLKIGKFDVSPIITGYYYPDAGKSLFDFKKNGGAHIFEAGLKINYSDFPVILSGYYNFHNDEGGNTYFEVCYSTNFNEIFIEHFIGITGGSNINPSFYNSANINVINLGIKAVKEVSIHNIKIKPFITFSVNPRAEKGFIIAGISI